MKPRNMKPRLMSLEAGVASTVNIKSGFDL